MTQVSRQYQPEPPNEVFTLNVTGNTPIQVVITNESLAVSLSSPNTGSHETSIEPGKGEVTIKHKNSSRDCLRDVSLRLQALEQEFEAYKKKDANVEILQREVLSRLAQGINDEHLHRWNTESEGQRLVEELRDHQLHFLPDTLTAEAISWWHKNGELLVPALTSYSAGEVEYYLDRASQNQRHQRIIDRAWERLWRADGVHEGTDLKLMLTAWAKRSCARNLSVRGPLSTAIAEEVVSLDRDFYETRSRAKEVIRTGLDSSGKRLFDDVYGT